MRLTRTVAEMTIKEITRKAYHAGMEAAAKMCDVRAKRHMSDGAQADYPAVRELRDMATSIRAAKP